MPVPFVRNECWISMSCLENSLSCVLLFVYFMYNKRLPLCEMRPWRGPNVCCQRVTAGACVCWCGRNCFTCIQHIVRNKSRSEHVYIKTLHPVIKSKLWPHNYSICKWPVFTLCTGKHLNELYSELGSVNFCFSGPADRLQQGYKRGSVCVWMESRSIVCVVLLSFFFASSVLLLCLGSFQ